MKSMGFISAWDDRSQEQELHTGNTTPLDCAHREHYTSRLCTQVAMTFASIEAGHLGFVTDFLHSPFLIQGIANNQQLNYILESAQVTRCLLSFESRKEMKHHRHLPG